MTENQEHGNLFLALNLDRYESLLKTSYIGRPKGGKNELWESIDSTSNRALELAKAGAARGLVVLAEKQTAGRGRRGNTWKSPSGAGLYASIILRPPRELVRSANLPLYTFAAGVACVLAIKETTGVEIGLKWVNDLVYQGKKIGGILAEMPSQGQGDAEPDYDPALVLGIGINISPWQGEVDPALSAKVDFLGRICPEQIDAGKLFAAICNSLEHCCLLIESNKGSELVDAWKRHSVTLNRRIRAETGSKVVEGEAIGVTAFGGLVVRTIENEEIVLHAGEISIRQADGSYA